MKDMSKLDLTPFLSMVPLLKANARQRAAAEERDPTPQSYRHLQPDTLEAHDWIERDAGYLKPKPVPLCGGCQDGWIYHRSERIGQRCPRCEIPRRWLQRLDRMRLPSDAIDMSFASYEPDNDLHAQKVSEFISYLKGHCESSPPTLLLYGPPGNGKTSLLYCLAREAAYHMAKCSKRGWRPLKVKFLSHIGMLNDIKNSYGDKKAQNPMRDWLAGVDLILMDEFGGVGGASNRNAWWREQTTQLIHEIYREWQAGKLAVVLTTNLRPRAIAEIFADNSAAQSRLAQLFPQPVEMKGRDRRMADVDMSAWGF